MSDQTRTLQTACRCAQFCMLRMSMCVVSLLSLSTMVSKVLKVHLSLYTLLRSHLFVNCCIGRYSIYTTRGLSHSLSRLIFIGLADWAFQVMLTASAVPLMIDFRNVGSPLELAPGSGCRFAPRPRWRLWLRPARAVFVVLQHANADHREFFRKVKNGKSFFNKKFEKK